MSSFVRISGWGKCLPSQILSNYDLEKMVDTSDEWIRTRSGISERRIVSEEETTSTIATVAAEQAMERAGIGPADLDLIILATLTPDYGNLPATASLVQHALGATNCGAFDLGAACSGFVYGLVTGSQFIQSGACRNVLVIGAESLSRVLDWKDRTTCVLFGDGAGAVVLSATEQEGGLLSFVLGSDGSGAQHLMIPAGGSRRPASHETVEQREHYIKMNGREVLNIDRYGNTSAASIPIALCEAIEEGKVSPGSLLAMVAFGSGLSWGSVLWRWQR